MSDSNEPQAHSEAVRPGGEPSAIFQVQPGNADGEARLFLQSGAHRVRQDTDGDIHIDWDKTDHQASLRFVMADGLQGQVEFDGISIGFERSNIVTGHKQPLAIQSEWALPADNLLLEVVRDTTWKLARTLTYNLMLYFHHVGTGLRWRHDPKIYNEGPTGGHLKA
jgi:hypothetical protein